MLDVLYAFERICTLFTLCSTVLTGGEKNIWKCTTDLVQGMFLVQYSCTINYEKSSLAWIFSVFFCVKTIVNVDCNKDWNLVQLSCIIEKLAVFNTGIPGFVRNSMFINNTLILHCQNLNSFISLKSSKSVNIFFCD